MAEDGPNKSQCPNCGKQVIRCDDCKEPMKYRSMNTIEKGIALYYDCLNDDCSIVEKRIVREKS